MEAYEFIFRRSFKCALLNTEIENSALNTIGEEFMYTSLKKENRYRCRCFLFSVS